MSHISNIIKEPWATPNRATPKNCYPFKKNSTIPKKNQKIKKIQQINPTIQKEIQNLKTKTSQKTKTMKKRKTYQKNSSKNIKKFPNNLKQKTKRNKYKKHN